MLQFGVLKYAESHARVRYVETDQMGIAHHASYLVWFEIGRTDLCRQAGIAYAVIEERGYLLVVTDIDCRYRTPFRYDDEIVIRTSVLDSASRSIKFGYELYDGSGTDLRASGSSSHLWLDRISRRPARAPEEIAALFEEWIG